MNDNMKLFKTPVVYSVILNHNVKILEKHMSNLALLDS